MRFLKADNLRLIFKTLWIVAKMLLWRHVSDQRIFQLGTSFVDLFLNISKRMKTIGIANIPSNGKAIFVSNHISVFDPIFITSAIYWATGGERRCAALMRNDFFKLSFINRRMNRYLLTPLFPRDSMKKDELSKVFKEIKDNFNRGIIIFTSGTRSKNGEVLSLYSEKRKEGLHLYHKKDPGRLIKTLLRDFKETVMLVPTTITYNYIDKGVGVIFGKPVLFDGKKDDRSLLNTKVDEVIRAIENQVYLGCHHLLPFLIEKYLHSGPKFIEKNGSVSVSRVKDDLKSLIDKLKDVYPYLEENIQEEFQRKFEMTINFYKKHNMIKALNDEKIRFMESKINLVPEMNAKFKKKNPFLFYKNQAKGVKILFEQIEKIEDIKIDLKN